MATSSSIPAWEVQWTEESGRLQSTGSRRVRQDLVTKQQQQLLFTGLGMVAAGLVYLALYSSQQSLGEVELAILRAGDVSAPGYLAF